MPPHPEIQQYRRAIESLSAYVKELETALTQVPLHTPGGHGVENAYLEAKDEWLTRHSPTLYRATYDPIQERKRLRAEGLHITKQVLNSVRMNNARFDQGDTGVKFLDIAQTIGLIEDEYAKLR